jgi:uncharacterized membrane protein YkvI
MTVRSVVVGLLLVLLVGTPAVGFASNAGATADTTRGHACHWQHAKRSATAWRNFSNALVIAVPVLVPMGEHEIVTSDLPSSFVAVASSIFVPPRG